MVCYVARLVRRSPLRRSRTWRIVQGPRTGERVIEKASGWDGFRCGTLGVVEVDEYGQARRIGGPGSLPVRLYEGAPA